MTISILYYGFHYTIYIHYTGVKNIEISVIYEDKG